MSTKSLVLISALVVVAGTACPAKVATVEVAPAKLELHGEGEEKVFQATVKSEKGEDIAEKKVTWSTSDPAVATVDVATGKVKAVGSGDATITAKVDEVEGKAQIHIAILRSVKADSPALVVQAGAPAQKINLAYMNERGEVMPGDAYKVEWTSSDPATVSVTTAGEVQGVQPGAATVTAKVNDLKSDVAVTVTAAAGAASADGGAAGSDGGAAAPPAPAPTTP
jgi:uncharacterized protein YjdB